MNIHKKLMDVQSQLKAPKIEMVNDGKRIYYIIECSRCHKSMRVRSDYITKHGGQCMSCLKRNNKQALRHGDCKTRLYNIWVGLKQRRYGTRQPKICAEWSVYENFKKWALSNGYNDNLTIDRINNEGNYEPNNCQWITLQENAGKDKKIYSIDEEKDLYNKRKFLGLTQRQMAKILGVSRNTVQRAEKRAKELL